MRKFTLKSMSLVFPIVFGLVFLSGKSLVFANQNMKNSQHSNEKKTHSGKIQQKKMKTHELMEHKVNKHGHEHEQKNGQKNGHGHDQKDEQKHGHSQKHRHDQKHGHDQKPRDEHKSGDKHGHGPKPEEPDDPHKHEDQQHEHEESHKSSKFGPDKAILEIKEEGQSFKLSSAAEKTLGIQFKSPISTSASQQFTVPKSSVVEYQDSAGIFRKKSDWFELIDIQVIKIIKDKALIYSKSLDAKDQIVFSGVGLLRVAHLEASGQGGQGHAH